MPKRTKENLDAQKNLIIDAQYLEDKKKKVDEVDVFDYLSTNVDYSKFVDRLKGSINNKINNNANNVDQELLDAQEAAATVVIAKQADKTLLNYELKLLDAEYKQLMGKGENASAEEINKKINDKKLQLESINKLEQLAADPKSFAKELNIPQDKINLKDQRYKENSKTYKDIVNGKSLSLKNVKDYNDVINQEAKYRNNYNKGLDAAKDAYTYYKEIMFDMSGLLEENNLLGKSEEEINHFLFNHPDVRREYNYLEDERRDALQSIYARNSEMVEGYKNMADILKVSYETGVITKEEFNKQLTNLVNFSEVKLKPKTFAIDTFPKTVNEFLKQRGLDKEGFTPEEAEGLYISAKMKAEMEKADYVAKMETKYKTDEKINASYDDKENELLKKIEEQASALEKDRTTSVNVFDKAVVNSVKFQQNETDGVVNDKKEIDADAIKINQDLENSLEEKGTKIVDADALNKEEVEKVDMLKIKPQMKHGWSKALKDQGDDFVQAGFDPDISDIDNDFNSINNFDDNQIDFDDKDLVFNKDELNVKPMREKISIDLGEEIGNKSKVIKGDNAIQKQLDNSKNK